MPTERHHLDEQSWADLGPTPCFLQLAEVYPVLFVIDTAAPASRDAAAHTLHWGGEASWCDIGLVGQRVYARAGAGAYGATVLVSR